MSLSSRAVWTSCERFCSGKDSRDDPAAAAGRRALWKAHDDAVGRLDDLHKPFLAQSGHVVGRSSLPDVIQQCLL